MIIDIPAGTNPTCDKMAILLAELLVATSLKKKRRQGDFINIHSNDLRRLLGRSYTKIVNEAILLGYVERNPRYAVSRFSKSFRLAHPYRQPLTAPYKLRQRGIPGCSYRLRLRPGDVVGYALAAHFDLVSLPPGIAEQTEGWPRFIAERVQRGDLYATRCKYGRYHTTFTIMPRKQRKQLRIQGKQVNDIDVANCQPLMVGLMAAGRNQREPTSKQRPQHKHKPCVVQSSSYGGIGCRQSRRQSRCGVGAECRCCRIIDSGVDDSAAVCMAENANAVPCAGDRDVDAFIDLCASGLLYESLLEICCSRGLTSWSFIPAEFRHPHAKDRSLTRKHIKKAFVIMLFCPNEAMLCMPIFEVLAEQFPSVARFIVDVKREHHADLARACQKFESSLMIDGVAADLVGRIPLLTIHDAIVAKEEDADVVESTIREHFSRLGVGVKVNRGD